MTKPMPAQDIPLKMAGGTAFGRYPKISVEQTWNMIVSDDWLVNGAGYKKVSTISAQGSGRGIFASVPFDRLIVVIDNGVYSTTSNNVSSKIATIETFVGDVFIAENEKHEIAICDKKNIYIYNYVAGTFVKCVLDFIPGYVSYSGGSFISVNTEQAQWRLCDLEDSTNWPDGASNAAPFQTKPDKLKAVVPFPGKGNLVIVFATTAGEPWYDTGQQLFPYQKNTFSNIDYGTLNAATIAASDSFIAWLGSNEKSGPTIMYSDGATTQPLSNDGVNFRLAQLKNPGNSYGFFYKQDGHLIYQITFPDPADNLSLIFDFNTKMIFNVSDQYQNYHIAKRVVYFANTYYFVSFNDGNLYELNSKYTTFDGEEIPRIRIPKTFRLPSNETFIVNSVTFPVEQGQDTEDARIDLCISNDGGESFGNYDGMQMNPLGKRKSLWIYYGLGYSNEFVPQFRFWGQGRFVVGNGQMSVYQ